MSDEKATPRASTRSIRLVEDRWSNVRSVVEAAAIVAAGLWAFYIFIYQEDIKPARDPAALVVTMSIHRMGRDARRDIVGVTANFTNAGKTEIDIAADGFDLWGIRYGSHPRPRRASTATAADIFADIPENSRTLVRASVELRDAAVGGTVGRHIILEPGSTEAIATTVVLPRGAYDALEGRVVALPVKTSSRDKVRVSIKHQADGGLWIQGHGWAEDDNRTEFALIP
jgi:hypothetical protein